MHRDAPRRTETHRSVPAWCRVLPGGGGGLWNESKSKEASNALGIVRKVALIDRMVTSFRWGSVDACYATCTKLAQSVDVSWLLRELYHQLLDVGAGVKTGIAVNPA